MNNVNICLLLVVRALVKEFSEPQRSEKTTHKNTLIQQPSKFKSSGFQSAKDKRERLFVLLIKLLVR